MEDPYDEKYRAPWTVMMGPVTIAEFDVVITDYILTAVSIYFAWRLFRLPRSREAVNAGEPFWFIVFYMCVATSTLVGGCVHGFLNDELSFVYRLTWKLTLAVVGLVAVAAYNSSFGVLFRVSLANKLKMTVVLAYLVYLSLILFFGMTKFLTAIVFYFPAASILLVSFASTWLRTRERAALLGTLGMSVTLCASFVQQYRVTVHPYYLTFNSVYHFVQLFGFYLTFLGARQRVMDSRVYYSKEQIEKGKYRKTA